METETTNNQSIISFINACNDLVDGKFILADIKISKILKSISQSTEIYNLIAESMINYDFDAEFEKAVVKNEQGVEKFELPEEAEKLIPLVFCLLVEIDSKRINLNDFIKAQFPLVNNQNEEYLAFAKTIIIPFRNAIAEIFNTEVNIKIQEKPEIYTNVIDEKIKELNEKVDDEESDYETLLDQTHTTTIVATSSPVIDSIVEIQKRLQEDEEVELLFDRILRLSRILEDKLIFIRNPLKKSNLELILDALLEATQIKNVKIIVALVMALNNFAGNDRHLKQEIRELNTICYNFYE